MTSPRVFLPGSTLGFIGSGQLGRMLAIEARQLGYRVHTFSQEEDSPTGQLADLEIVGSYSDETAVRSFAKGIDLLTFEFENIPAQTVEWCSAHCVVRPAGRVLHICQHRLREKQFLSENDFPLPGFAAVSSLAELESAVAKLGTPSVLKTAAFGYDGKGQRKLSGGENLAEVWKTFGETPAVLEAWVPFEKEISIIVARDAADHTAVYPVCENVHRNHILDVTIVPGEVSAEVAKRAQDLAVRIATSLELVGLMAVEMFLLPSGEILVNELAPRTHNSGHFSLDASVTSQFEQQLRAVCGLPLGSTESLRPAAMANLLGDVWAGGEPDWRAALAIPQVKLHLYGKAEPRAGRKMGHLVAFGETTQQAAERVREARAALRM